MQYIQLSDNQQIPMLGFGVFQIAPEHTEQAVLDAIKAGYRHIDTAQAYLNEKEVGQAIAKSGVDRKELFITTKVWLTNYLDARASIERSLAKLGTDYIDLVLLHQPFNDTFSAWRDLIALKTEGKIHAIGVSNFTPSEVASLGLYSKVMPQVNQIEVNPFHQRPEQIAQLQEMGITVQAWAPFAEGMDDIFNHPVLKGIADKYHKTTAQVIERWLIEQNIIVLAKSSRAERMVENLNIFDFSLNEEDKKHIRTLDLGQSHIFRHDDPKAVAFLANYEVHGI
ncbi:aldo/keto reductase [Pelistega ratti]|uniref:aldo/keto reductase n=1 Tax=Pelistega ratti TaxID=2652177 RepID=UPI001358CE3F|nr:aldo/keto reductase [Pelistega ratti]